MRPLPTLVLVAAALLALSGCGDSDERSSHADENGATSTTPAAAATETYGTDPVEGAETDPVEGKATAQAGEIALLERVVIGRYEGLDRVGFQFRNHVPRYRIENVEPPLKEDGSGNVVQIKGNAFLVVRMEPASGFDLAKNEGELVYKGPKRIDGSAAGTSLIQEVVRTGDFEAVLTWAIGLSDRVDFRVRTSSSPPRLIVDLRNH
jgi:hypothetical protein